MSLNERFSNLKSWSYRFKNSISNFVKSSFLSLIIVVLILLLLYKMDQAFTLFIDIIENRSERMGLFLSFFFVNTLAVALSHYPIYNYYSANLNGSDAYTLWTKSYPYKYWPFKKLAMYMYYFKPGNEYTPDKNANLLRYSIGLLIHVVWMVFIVKAFERNLVFGESFLVEYKVAFYAIIAIPFVLYRFIKNRIYKIEAVKNDQEREYRENRIYKRIGIAYAIVCILCATSFILTLLFVSFSRAGLTLMLCTSYFFMLNYVFFRLARTKLSKIEPLVTYPLKLMVKAIKPVEKPSNYLLVFLIIFLIALVYLLYTTVAAIQDWYLPNSLPILLGYFYLYYFIIANIGKYLFAAKKMEHEKTTKYFLVFLIPIFLFLLYMITGLFNLEVKTHELDLVNQANKSIDEKTFTQGLQAMEGDDIFFIASHGGGTKSNVWTLNVINKLQEKTQGKLLDRTVAMSGASGGSLGVALYMSLYKEDQKNYSTIQNKIDQIAKENFTSIDLTLTFGLDSYRKLWPLNQNIGIKDRPYYSMRKYQNMIEEKDHRALSLKSYREYWGEIYAQNNYFPTLIMNTAATNGKRGILWSVKQKDFDAIFPFAENLADLSNNKTLPYYQAVSTTDRFPVFSPAAKIPGYGHYIDAGAIDNSGLLSCLDLHNYLYSHYDFVKEKNIHYIEILNSKALYISYLLEKFKDQNQVLHIDKNEKETDNIVADLQTGLNLDKIPGYIGDYLNLMDQNSEGKVKYYRIYMPHKVNMNDIESHLNGKIIDKNLKKQIEDFLAAENQIIFDVTEQPEKSFFEPWLYYEPTLSRHLSESSLNYIHEILKHPMLNSQFNEINNYLSNN